MKVEEGGVHYKKYNGHCMKQLLRIQAQLVKFH
jgi:hypothetical protein